MFNKNIKTVLASLLIGIIIFSCKKSFLERIPDASFNEVALANQKGVNSLLIATYAALDGWAEGAEGSISGGVAWPTAGSNWIWGSVTSDDASPGSDPSDQVPMERMNRYQYQTDDPYIRAKYQSVFWGAGRANSTLNILAKATDVTPENRVQIEAEARFLRAHFHFDGYRMWKNIPFIDEKTTEYRQKNDVDIFPKIEADLQFAISKLSEKANNASGRTNKGAAQALLARAYIHVGKYAQAKPLLDAVISSGKYVLVDNFHDMFDAAKQNNTEMVFAYKSSVNDGSGQGQNGNIPDRLMGVHNMPGVNGCCGFHTATYDLLNGFKTDATGLPLSTQTFNNADYNPTTDNLDPRVDFTFARPGVPYYDWGIFQAAWVRNVGYTGPFSQKKNAFHKGQYKNLSTATGWSDWPNAIDIPLIRYSDVLLMAAECEIETNGDLGKAKDYINLVRARAGKYVQGTGTSEATISQTLPAAVGDVVSASLNNTNYKIGLYPAFASQAAAREALRWERRLELAMEGHRYFDLVRWGVAADVLNKHVAKEVNKMSSYIGSETFTAKHNLYPIPSVEIELSRINGVAQLKQNPGY